jgi:aryl-alcohol dehydrogenase-like predicted oxidoreductase
MKYRELGRTGLHVSAIGFGTWGLGGATGGSVSYGPASDDESRSALRAAAESGVNFFDTADLYGFGHSEKLLGEVFRESHTNILIASKAGFRDAQTQDFSLEHLRQSLEGSLKRLGRDWIDLYQLHSPPLNILRSRPETIDLLRRFQREGKIRAWGVSARSPDEARSMIEEFEVPCVQVNFNLTDQRARENGLFELCGRSGVGLIIRTPLCFGFLTGEYASGVQFDPMDHRSRWSPEQVQRWREANDTFRFLFATDPDATPAQIALRFCLSYPGVSSVIPGMLTPAHARENVAAGEFGPLLPADLLRAEERYQTQNFFSAATPQKRMTLCAKSVVVAVGTRYNGLLDVLSI